MQCHINIKAVFYMCHDASEIFWCNYARTKCLEKSMFCDYYILFAIYILFCNKMSIFSSQVVTGLKKVGFSRVIKNMSASFFTRDKVTYADPGGIFSMSNQSAALDNVCPCALHMVFA